MDASAPLDQVARYRHPVTGGWGRMIAALVGCPAWAGFRRRLIRFLSMPALASDVINVAYLNWWVDPQALPKPPRGHRYWTRAGRTPFTILTYRHGHFGPAFLGRARGAFPSPLQSNWRWYLQRDEDPVDANPIVLFARNVMDGLPHVIGARICSDAMQPQLAIRMHHGCDHGTVATLIEPGDGGAPELSARLRIEPEVPSLSDWPGSFGTHTDAIRFLACQEAAIAVAPDGAVAETIISLPVALDEVQALRLLDVQCPLLQQMGANPANAFCFLLPNVAFRVVSERLL